MNRNHQVWACTDGQDCGMCDHAAAAWTTTAPRSRREQSAGGGMGLPPRGTSWKARTPTHAARRNSQAGSEGRSSSRSNPRTERADLSVRVPVERRPRFDQGTPKIGWWSATRRKMSVAKKEEVCSHRLGPRLGVPIKKRPLPNAEISSSSVLKEEEVDQGFRGFPSADSHKDTRATGELKSTSFDSSFGKLPNLDLNVPLDPLDPAESLPVIHDCGSRVYQETVQHQKAHVALGAPVSTVCAGLRQNIDSTLNLSKTYGLSNMRRATDVTLDLQLKPPTRPEIGINWKELAPVPELTLSLSGNKHVDESENNAPSVAVRSEPAGSDRMITREVGMQRRDKSPVEKSVRLAPCNENPHKTMPSTVAGMENMASGHLVKKEPEEQSQRPTNVENAQLLELQGVGLANNRAEVGKTDIVQVPGKSDLDLNSVIIPNVATAKVTLPTERLCNAINTETMHADPEVKRPIKCEETTTVTPSPAFSSISGCSPLVATEPLPLNGCNASPTIRLCSSASQPTLPTEPTGCNPDEASVDCKPTISQVHSRDAIEASGPLLSSTNHAESLVSSCQNRAAVDGMSQGSAEMDCSEDDDDNIVSRLPNTNKPHGGIVGNNQIFDDGMGANNVGINVPTGYNSGTHQDCSFVTNKVVVQGVRDDEHIDVKDGTSSHSYQDRHQNGDVFNQESENKQLLILNKNSAVNNNDNIMPVKTVTGSSSADLRRLSSSGTSASPKMESTVESHTESGSCLEKGKNHKLKLKGCQSPLGKPATNSSEDHGNNASVKSEHQTGSEEIARVFELHPRDSVMAEDSNLDGASSSQPHNDCGMVKAASERMKEMGRLMGHIGENWGILMSIGMKDGKGLCNLSKRRTKGNTKIAGMCLIESINEGQTTTMVVAALDPVVIQGTSVVQEWMNPKFTLLTNL
ncbi:hypothetical protein GUJ93_ZPchr0003g18465 [Zizania palustris]|uniref:Uncharacterized protein n=1 Tax=Zizania palustris TaxID=103762 RepID=A0A8J5S9T2_ZIZPA|nr:hypothetical protein GUJ93_ZPchr0003g18465 [Zizania palustris]